MTHALKTLSLALLAGVAAAAAVPVTAAPVPTPPAAQAFRLGAFDLVALRDAQNVVPNDTSVFGKGRTPAAVAAVLAKAGAPTDSIALGVDALLVKIPGHVVLIDTGLGPKVGGVLMASLAAAGVRPDAITDVLITHSHPDHTGGLLTADGGLAFPAATIRMSAAEWTYLQGQPRAQAMVRTIAAKVRPFVPGTPVLPGITPVAVRGHTPGHVAYQLRSGEHRLIDIGDSAHSAIVSLAEPDWAIGYDGDPDTGAASRRALLTRLAGSGEALFAPHFPFPGVGHVVAKGTGFAFVPGMP